VLGASS
jgi:hypothetical protein